MSTIIINTDGGARGNPGPAGIGVVFSDQNSKVIHTYYQFIGKATNNQAEYTAVIKALEIIKKSSWFRQNNQSDSKLIFRLDSQLVVEQINGNYKVKNNRIKELIDEIRSQLNGFETEIEFVFVSREENKLADKLVNKALDENKK